MDKKLSLISTEYSLHINHIQKAREHFERECCSFLNEVSVFLNKKFEEVNSKDVKLEFRCIDECKTGNYSHAKNFWINSSYAIHVKMGVSTNSRKEVIGHLRTGIEFDQTDQMFNWFMKFENENTLDPQIDERSLSKIMSYPQEKKCELFGNFDKVKYNDLYFFKKILDDTFDKNFEPSVNHSFNILVESIVECDKFVEFHGKRTVNRIRKIAA